MLDTPDEFALAYNIGYLQSVVARVVLRAKTNQYH